jgi:hypothetical protein
MFHIPTLRERRAERGLARLSAACFDVHCFAGNASVNSLLHCWALDGEWERLWKSLCARRNISFTVARRACAITRSYLLQFVENILLRRASYGVEAHVVRLPGVGMWEFVPRTLSRRPDTLRSQTDEATLCKNKKKHF